MWERLPAARRIIYLSPQPAFAEGCGGHEMPFPQKKQPDLSMSRKSFCYIDQQVFP